MADKPPRVRKSVLLLGVLGLALAGLLAYHLRFRAAPGPAVVSLDDPAVEQAIRENSEKVLVIGLDGASWPVIFPLLARGRMPNFERLLQNGGRGVLHSIPPLISPALWTTIATGRERADHGITNFLTKRYLDYDPVRITTALRRVPALWNILAEQGKKTAVVNWYAAYPAEKIPGGIFVAEGITPERLNADYVQPAEWAEILRGLEPITDPLMEANLSRWDHPVPSQAYELDRFVTTVGREILRRERPAAVFVYLQHIDVISHGFWKYYRPQGLDYRYPISAEEHERYGDVLEEYYAFTDRLVGELADAAEGYTIVIVSDHGLDAIYPPKNIFFNLNRLLEALGYLAWDQPTCESRVNELIAAHTLQAPQFKNMAVFELCRALESAARAGGPSATAGELVQRGFLAQAGVEGAALAIAGLAELAARDNFREEILWPATRAFNIEDFHDPVQGIYLNLQGREPEGVAPEAEYERFRDQLAAELGGLRTEDGQNLFRQVRPNPQKRKIPLGPDDPPDLLVEWEREALGREMVLRLAGDRDPLPLASLLWSYSDVSGDHVPEGIWLISGAQAAGFEPFDAGILDLTPTLLWFFGLPVGADMPGQPMTQAFAESVRGRPVRYLPSWTPLWSSRVEGGGAALDEAKRRQFEAVGYLQKNQRRDPPVADEEEE